MTIFIQTHSHSLTHCPPPPLRPTRYTANARDIKFDVDRVVSHRSFLNKVWNAARFALAAAIPAEPGANSGHDNTISGDDGTDSDDASDSSSLATTVTASCALAADGPAGLPHLDTLQSAWIVSRLAATVCEANAALKSFNFAQYTTVLFDFWVHDLCDTYIELAKKDLRGGDVGAAETTRTLLVSCVAVATRLLAPATPFLADAILEAIPRRASSNGNGANGDLALVCDPVCLNAVSYPDSADWEPLRSASVERRMKDALELARAIRALPVRQIDPQARLAVFVRPT